VVETKEVLAVLVQLQTLDSTLSKLDKEIAEIPKQIEALRQQAETTSRWAAKSQSDVQNIEKERKTLELELGNNESNISKYRSQLLQVKTNKEYSALQVEIDTLKSKNASIEERILHLMDDVEVKKGEATRINKQVTAEQEKIKVFTRDKEIEKARLEEERVRIQKEKQVLIESLPDKKIIQEYTKLVQVRGGVAVVAVEQGNCTGCHVSLTPQMFAEVKMREKVIRCPNCFRFLYLPK
jgi:hypothetical protein